MSTRGVILILLVALCTICGCLGALAPPQPAGGCITVIDPPEPLDAYTLMEAVVELDRLEADGLLNVTTATVHLVLGSDVDTDGRAASWVLGLRDGDEERWFAFGAGVWQEVSLHAPLPADAVDITRVLAPETILRNQEEVLSGVRDRLGADSVDITLTKGIYSVTVRSDTWIEIFSFPADAGEVVV